MYLVLYMFFFFFFDWVHYMEGRLTSGIYKIAKL